MGKTRDLFKKIRDTKGTFHAKRGTIKGQKWSGSHWRRFFFFKGGKNTHNYTKKVLMTQITTMV